MNYWVEKIEENLTEEEAFFLKKIYEPQVVSIPPNDACRNMCVTPDGEIRIYGAIDRPHFDDPGTPVYSASRDGGLTWKTHLSQKGCLGPAGYCPETGRYISVYPHYGRPEWDTEITLKGTWALFNDEGYDCTENKFVKLADKKVHVLKHPFYLESIKRWFILGEYSLPDYSEKFIVIFYSDDNGESWTEVFLEKHAPKYEMNPPHKHPRWQQYSCEPTLTELSNGELVMIVRTSQDYHYMYRSTDKGESWSDPVPSPFYGTITMPVLHKLNDGRIVFFWCNTKPMPEIDPETAFPPLSDDEISGKWEDVFTNRDANHLAISEDDMNSWNGFREVFLHQIRNNADFRSVDTLDSIDKSIHQGQMLELPFNKLLIHFGQNISSRKVVILDLDWLYETKRSENFRFGLSNVSTQMYTKSILGGFRGHSGHCAYNRTNGALLVPDPEGNCKEVLQLCRVEDERLVYKKQGVVWNFPAAKQGTVKIDLKVLKSGVRISVCDRWYNPADEMAGIEAPISFDITENGDWKTITIEYDTEKMQAKLTIGTTEFAIKLKKPAPNGLSYLHIQTLAEKEDLEGTLIREFEKF